MFFLTSEVSQNLCHVRITYGYKDTSYVFCTCTICFFSEYFVWHGIFLYYTCHFFIFLFCDLSKLNNVIKGVGVNVMVLAHNSSKFQLKTRPKLLKASSVTSSEQTKARLMKTVRIRNNVLEKWHGRMSILALATIDTMCTNLAISFLQSETGIWYNS
jgi:hypothetical protein